MNEKPLIKDVIVDKPKVVLKSYSALTLLANFCIALSYVAFSLLSAIELNLETLTFWLIVMFFSAIGLIGRFIKQDIDGSEYEGPMGFKGLSIRFLWYLERQAKLYLSKVKSWFSKK